MKAKTSRAMMNWRKTKMKRDKYKPLRRTWSARESKTNYQIRYAMFSYQWVYALVSGIHIALPRC